MTELESINASQSAMPSRGAVVKQIETRLLAHTREVHGESGRHEIVVQPCTLWARQAKVKPLRSASAAKRQIEEAATVIGATPRDLPWG